MGALIDKLLNEMVDASILLGYIENIIDLFFFLVNGVENIGKLIYYHFVLCLYPYDVFDSYDYFQLIYQSVPSVLLYDGAELINANFETLKVQLKIGPDSTVSPQLYKNGILQGEVLAQDIYTESGFIHLVNRLSLWA